MNIKILIRYLIIFVVVVIMGCASEHDLLMNSKNTYLNVAINTAHPAIRDAAQALLAGNPEQANDILNRILGYEPRNPMINLLNGMAYQARAVGEGQYWDMAKVGYQLAYQFDPYFWQAPYLLGLIYMQERNFAAAITAFSDATLANPRTAIPLYGLAAASYVRGDLSIAYRAIQQAILLDGGNPLPQNGAITALCLAAAGNFTDAEKQIAALKVTGVASWEIQRLEQKIRIWQEFYAHPETTPPTKNDNNGGGQESTDETSKPQRMAILEAIIMRMSTVDSYSRGINLLEGLATQFEGTLVNTKTKTTGLEGLSEDSDKTEHTLNLSIPAVKYTLNIVNTSDSFSRIEAHPSILALDGKESKVFVGSDLTVLTGGDLDSTFEKEFGFSITVTPTFLSDEYVQLEVGTELSVLNGGAPPALNMKGVSLNKMVTNSSAVMKFGQTLVVSTGTIQEEDHNRSGVPILNQTPLIDNFFSNNSTRTLKGNLLVLFNLKPPSAKDSAVHAYNILDKTQSFYQVQQQLPPIASPMLEQLQNAQSRDVLTLISPNDAQLQSPIRKAWQEQPLQQWQQQFMQEIVAR